MTLEDFFTLTEMRDGLTAPSRVEELLTVMKEEKDSAVKNVSDATRQWGAVASTIAATENKGCLDLFVQLDGLWFLDRWLKDAQEFGNESSDSFVEESITALLRALEKLHRNNERCISSEIWITVKNLLGHNSSRVQDKARLLFDKWKRGRVTDDDGSVDSGEKVSEHGVSDSATVVEENIRPECSAKNGSVPRGSAHEENEGADAAKDEPLPSSSLDSVQPESAKALHIETTNNELDSHTNSDRSDMGNRSPNHKPVQDTPSLKEELPAKTVDESAEACSLSDSKQENLEVSGAQKLNELSNEKQKLDMSISSSSTVENVLISSGAGGGSAEDAPTESTTQNDAEANKKGDIIKSLALRDERMPLPEPKKVMGDVGIANHSDNGSKVFKTTVQDGESHLDKLRSSLKNEFSYRKSMDLVTTYSRMDDIGTTDEVKEKGGVEGLRGSSKYSRSPDRIDKRMSDIELEYGIVDALEVARKVAREVEREVVSDREPSCSSSEKISEGGIRQPSTPDSTDGKQELPTEAIPKEGSSEPNQSAEAYTEGEGRILNSDAQDKEPENDLHDMESSQVTVAQEPDPNTEKSLCDFDLNQEVCSDDMERAVNSVSTPISVVSASRAAAAPGLPAAPLQFEGTLGWKGCAATSAFRPASPRRNSDGDKTLSIGGTSSSSKRLDCLDFDLNVAEAGDEKVAELMSGKQVTASSGHHSAESSLEVSPRKSERFKLDLNRISDDGDAPALDVRVEGRLFFNRNGNRSPSPASSSSSMQPSLRNIDLNDRPYSQNDASEQGLYHGRSSRNVNAYGGPKPNDPVISIMGTKVEVSRKDFVPQVASLPNGKALEPATDASSTRSGGLMGLGPTVSYTHSPSFGYNGLTMGPTMSFSSTIYGADGSIPYVVDSRAPVVPQIMGSTSAVPPAYSQPQFIMSAPVGLNGSGPSRLNFDLNSGLAIDGGNRDSMSLRQPFMPGQGRSMEEHMRANSQPSSSSGVGAKRKEPEGGWEPFPFSYRQHQFPWK